MKLSMESACLCAQNELPPGVEMFSLPTAPANKNDWLAWFPLNASICGSSCTVGLLTAIYLPEAEFSEVEWHSDPELFLIVSGEGTMLLPNDGGWKLVRLLEGTTLRIAKGIPHYFGPSLTPAVLCVVANCPDARTEYRSLL